MAAGHEELDQLDVDESRGSRDKRGRPCVGCHVASVGCRDPATTHGGRTELVRRPYELSGKMKGS